MRSFVKIKSSRNGEITLSFTDIGKSSPCPEFLLLQICLLLLFAQSKILAKTSESTIVVMQEMCRPNHPATIRAWLNPPQYAPSLLLGSVFTYYIYRLIHKYIYNTNVEMFKALRINHRSRYAKIYERRNIIIFLFISLNTCFGWSTWVKVHNFQNPELSKLGS